MGMEVIEAIEESALCIKHGDLATRPHALGAQFARTSWNDALVPR
jgi:hypothetical protein